jgi:hypothetical protein
MKMMDDGRRLKEIRASIEKTYSKQGRSTATPAVPESFKEFWPLRK